ncbi:MAG: SGNH/GDSL hydrolase family protein, partial [Clostridium sp.]
MNILKQVYIYGDSILRGILLDGESKQYRPMSENKLNILEEQFPIQILNKSKFGRTIDKGYKEIKRMIEKDTPCDIAILEYGGNDCDHKWNEIANDPSKVHSPNTSIEVFEKTYFKIITELKSKKIEPVIMSLPPIDSQRY